MLSRFLLIGLAGVFASVAGSADTDSASREERRVVAEARFAVTNARAQAEMVQLVVDFPPGAWTSSHWHGGQAVNVVVEGEITLRQGEVDRPHGAGRAWSDSSGQVHAAGNTGAGEARLITTFFLPRGAERTVALDHPQLPPAVTYEAVFALPDLQDGVEMVQQVADLPAGWRAERVAEGFTTNMVISGQVTYVIGGNAKTCLPGEAWSADAAAPIREQTDGTARVLTTYLVPSR
jgi:quercetin dioxygenase-like cupin family protein